MWKWAPPACLPDTPSENPGHTLLANTKSLISKYKTQAVNAAVAVAYWGIISHHQSHHQGKTENKMCTIRDPGNSVIVLRNTRVAVLNVGIYTS